MFVLLFPDAGTVLVGPFADVNAAGFFGESWQEANGDDPRWQVVPTDNFERRQAE